MRSERYILTDHISTRSARKISPRASLLDKFLGNARICPKAPAIWVNGGTSNYESLRNSAMTLAGTLAEFKKNKNDMSVGVIADRSEMSFVAILAALAVGLPYVPIHPKNPVARNISIIEKSNCAILLIDELSAGVAREILSGVNVTINLLWMGERDPPTDFILQTNWLMINRSLSLSEIDIDRSELAESRIAYIMFTSGSTGMPKGVAVSHANVMAYVEVMLELYNPKPEDRFTQLFEQTFDLSVHDIFVAWSAGASIYCVPAEEQHAPGRFVKRHALTFWFSTPSTVAFMDKLKLLPENCFPELKTSLFCGEALPKKIAESWQRAAPNSRIENLYGPSETTIAITRYIVTEEILSSDRDLVPIGLPLGGHSIGICDEELNLILLNDGVEGELVLSGKQVSMGYWKEPRMTDERFHVGLIGGPSDVRWYRTGDKVRFNEGSGLEFLGRLDDQIKIRGYRVELQEIEITLRKVSGSGLVAACLLPKTVSGADEIVAFICGNSIESTTLRERCAEFLPNYMIPRKFVFVENMPLTKSGKIDRKALLALLDVTAE